MTKVDDKPAPTEEQVKAQNDATMAEWEGDFKEEDLTVPYKREEAAKVDEKEDIQPDVDEDVEEYSEPTPVVTVADPGEYKPADYSFEVTLKDGKTVKVGTVDDAERIADDPDNFETPKQLMDFINKQNKMRVSLDKDHDKWEADKAAYDTQAQEQAARVESMNTMVSEFEYLVAKKLIPPVAKEYKDADWTDPEVAKQPGVKEQTILLNYMVKENKARTKAGIKPLTSVVDAFNAWRQENGQAEAEQAQKEAGEARKAASARVAGVSASNQAPYAPKGIAVGRTNVLGNNQAVWED